jgi:ring-1,2-phenylacetyl-CoA epoxidase subunit PaaE
MTRFFPLLVKDIQRDIRDAVIVTLEPQPNDRESFKFIQGQYLTFRREFEGEELRRSYSICSGINDNKLRVGIKKVEDGWFSSWANEELKIGDTLDAMEPNGRFYAPLKPDDKRQYIGFAGGSGITPLISIIKTVLEEEPHSSFTLVYGNRSRHSIMFRQELEDLKSDYMDRLSILHILESDAADIDLFNGRVDQEKCDALFDRWIDIKRMDMAFICGPEPMMISISDALKTHGLAKDKIKFELFKSSPPKKKRTRSASAQEATEKSCTLTIRLDGTSHELQMSMNGEEKVLDAALNASLDVPFSCRAGVCSTCSAKVIKGEVEMESNYGLEDYEVERGYVLTCQSRPLTEHVEIEYDV